MNTQVSTVFQLSQYEQAVINIMHRLPPERVLQLVDFARFLELQATQKSLSLQKEEGMGTVIENRADEEKWDEVLAHPGAKQVMRAMAQEARGDYHAGRATDITVTEDGNLAPK